MEGTISTLEEVLRLEADADDLGLSPSGRNDALEVALYARALKGAEKQISAGYEISQHLIKNTHAVLLSHGRGAEKGPGQYKSEQNYIGERRTRRIDFIPASPEHLEPGMDDLIRFIRESDFQPLLKTAIAHVEFEALHPFDDGNGRLGRMLITLMLWKTNVLSAPHFFVSDYFERNKDEYIATMRAVSAERRWTDWCEFFLTAIEDQALTNIDVVGKIQSHYEEMRERFRDVLRSRWSTDALNYIFANPIFRNNRFKSNAGIPPQTANNFTNRLVQEGLLTTVIPPAGRAPGMYAFQSLLEIVAEPR
jgi:Fic family protein